MIPGQKTSLIASTAKHLKVQSPFVMPVHYQDYSNELLKRSVLWSMTARSLNSFPRKDECSFSGVLLTFPQSLTSNQTKPNYEARTQKKHHTQRSPSARFTARPFEFQRRRSNRHVMSAEQPISSRTFTHVHWSLEE